VVERGGGVQCAPAVLRCLIRIDSDGEMLCDIRAVPCRRCANKRRKLVEPIVVDHPHILADAWTRRAGASRTDATGAHRAPQRVPPVCQSARRVASVTISAQESPDETTCKCPQVASRPGFGPHHSQAMNDGRVVTSKPRRNMRVCSDYLAPGKPTRGLEPRTPALRDIVGMRGRAHG
jgi:hypothetical protein